MSGRKNFLNNFKIVSAGDMSQATVTSSIVNIQGLDNIGIQVNLLTGTPTGTFDVKISADHQEVNGVVKTTGNFIALGSSYQVTMTAGSPSNIYFDLSQLSATFIELVWTKTSGTGTFDAFVVGKML